MSWPRHNHGSHISALATSHTGDLLAFGGTHTVEVLFVPTDLNHKDAPFRCIASWHVGSRITSLAWSPKTTSPVQSENWYLEIVAAVEDHTLHELTHKHGDGHPYDYTFGTGTSGHQGRVNDVCYIGGDDAGRYVASVSDDKMLLVWDMHPPEPQSREDPGWTPMMSTRPVPVAFAHPQAYPLKSVESHPTSSRELLVADAVGNIILTDWRADESVELTQRSTELVHPRALADKVTGLLPKSGSVSWRSDNIVGAVYSSSVALWDLNINGKPTFTGTSFPEGGHRFRWCRPFPEYFAVSSLSGVKGALISVWNMQFLHAPPKTFVLASKPIKVADFDFLGGSTAVPRIAAAFGHEIMVFAIGE